MLESSCQQGPLPPPLTRSFYSRGNPQPHLLFLPIPCSLQFNFNSCFIQDILSDTRSLPSSLVHSNPVQEAAFEHLQSGNLCFSFEAIYLEKSQLSQSASLFLELDQPFRTSMHGTPSTSFLSLLTTPLSSVQVLRSYCLLRTSPGPNQYGEWECSSFQKGRRERCFWPLPQST